MENFKGKRVIGLIGSIIALVLGVMSFIGGFVYTIRMFSDVHETLVKETICFIIMAISGAIMIIFGALSCRKPRVKNGKLNFSTGAKITILASAFVSIITCFIEEGSVAAFYIALVIGYDTFFLIFEILLFIPLATLFIISLCMKSPLGAEEYQPSKEVKTVTAQVHKNNDWNGVDMEILTQIRSLKKMEEEQILTEKQFTEAIKKYADTFKDKILKGNKENESQV